MENNAVLPFHLVIYTGNNKFYAQNSQTGTIEHQANDASDLFDQVRKSRTIYIKRGIYPLSRPLRMISGLELIFEKGAFLEVPSGYDQEVIRFGDGVRFASIDGCVLREAQSPQSRWTGVRFVSSGKGVFDNQVKNIEIWRPHTGLLLEVDVVEGWVNGNEIRSSRITEPNTFIEFRMSVPWRRGQNGFNRNHFQHLIGQAGPETRWGARDIRHRANQFIDVKFWDLRHPEVISSNVHQDAEDTLILGGIMTNRRFENKGLRTQIIDPFRRVTFDDVGIWSAEDSMVNIRRPSLRERKRLAEELLKTPVVLFQREGGGPSRLGVITEDAPDHFLAEGNDQALALPNYISNLHLALQEHQRRIDRLEGMLQGE